MSKQSHGKPSGEAKDPRCPVIDHPRLGPIRCLKPGPGKAHQCALWTYLTIGDCDCPCHAEETAP